MKVMQINVVYNTGSTGKIMFDIHTELMLEGIESVICYGRGEKTSDAGVYKTCGELYSKLNNLASRFTGIMYGGCILSTSKLISIIKKEKPDVVHLHCINGYFVNVYRLVSWLKKSGIKTVLTLHAEFMHTANCGYAFECEKWKNGCGKCPRFKAETKSLFIDGTHRSWMKMKRAFKGFEKLTVISVSPWLMERAKQSPILKDFEHVTILNGLDTDVFHPSESNIKAELGIENKKMVFHATPKFDNDPANIKGGHYLIELAKMMKDTAFVIAGNHPEGLELPDNMILVGRINDQRRLAEYYSAADLTVLTSKRETFSMIVAESLSCGTPVAGFMAGAPEMISIPEYSRFVRHGDLESLYGVAREMLDLTLNRNEIALSASEKYSKERMAEQYIDAYKTRS